MTRGTGILLLNETTLVSVEFNGDMGLHGYGNEFMQGLSKVNDKHEFEEFIIKFNDKYFNHDDSEFDFLYPNELMYDDKKFINLSSLEFTSDWLFFKNASNKTIQIISKCGKKTMIVNLEPGETVRFYFDTFVPKYAYK